MQNEIVQEIMDFSWFKPREIISIEEINRLVQAHQERLKNFGLGNIYPCQLMKIWPGQKPEIVLQMREESRNSVLYLVMENVVFFLREITVDNWYLEQLDILIRETENKLKNIVREAGIEAAGITTKSTLSVPVKGTVAQDSNISQAELDMLEKAVEDAVSASIRHVTWCTLEFSFISSGQYGNPFFPLMNLFQMGLWPLGVVKNKYMVLIPGK